MPSPYSAHAQLASSATPDHSHPQVVPGHNDKGSPFATNYQFSGTTPDYSAPQVIEQPYYDYPQNKASVTSTAYGNTSTPTRGRPYGFKEHVDTNDGVYQTGAAPPPVPPKEDRKCGMKKRKFYIMIGCILIWLIALGVGLGVGLGLGLKKESYVEDFHQITRQYTDLGTVVMTRLIRFAVPIPSTVSVARSAPNTSLRRAHSTEQGSRWRASLGTRTRDESSQFTFSITQVISDIWCTLRIDNILAVQRHRRWHRMPKLLVPSLPWLMPLIRLHM